jgi:opacity protein-like surface antigen
MGRLALLGLSACLASAASAADAISSARQASFGDVTVYYNTFNSTFLQPDIARSVELIRSKDQGVINVSVFKAGKPYPAQVAGTVRDLTGTPVPLRFKQITEHGAVSSLAQFAVPQRETRIFDISFQAGGATNRFSFNQEIFPGQ